MKATDALGKLQEIVHSRPSYWSGLIKLRFANDLDELMNNANMSQTELARQVRKSPQYISKVLSGDQNLTMDTMVQLLWPFKLVPRIDATHKDEFYQLPVATVTLDTSFFGDQNSEWCLRLINPSDSQSDQWRMGNRRGNKFHNEEMDDIALYSDCG